MQNRIKNLTIELARNLRHAGMKVYISDNSRYNYGYFSDSMDGKAIYFQIDQLSETPRYFSGCKPSRSYGTGCNLDVTDPFDMTEVTKLPNSKQPVWYKRPESDRLTLLEVAHDTNSPRLTSQF